MNKVIAIALWTPLLLVSCVSNGGDAGSRRQSQVVDQSGLPVVPGDFKVDVERIPGRGADRGCKSVVYADGTVQFFIKTKEYILDSAWRVDLSKVREISARLGDVHYFALGDRYAMQIRDCSYTVIGATDAQREKRVVNLWVGARSRIAYPESVDVAHHELLDSLAQKIEELAGSRQKVVATMGLE